MGDTETTADVVNIRPEMRWTSEAERDEYLAEAARRKEAGESLDGLVMPVYIEPGGVR